MMARVVQEGEKLTATSPPPVPPSPPITMMARVVQEGEKLQLTSWKKEKSSLMMKVNESVDLIDIPKEAKDIAVFTNREDSIMNIGAKNVDQLIAVVKTTAKDVSAKDDLVNVEQ